MAEIAPETGESAVSQKVARELDRPMSRRWMVRGGIMIVLLATGVWFAPAIVATTSLRQRVPKLIFPTYPGAVEVGETSLGWLSPVVVKGLRAEDEEGHTLVDIQEFSTAETLWTLATRSSNLGRLKLVDPVVTVSLRNNGSNLEDVLTKWLGGPRSGSPIPAYELEVVNARIELEHRSASRTSAIEPVSLVMASSKGGVDELEMTVGRVPSSDSNEGDALAAASDWLAIRYGSRPTDEGVVATTGTQHVRLKARGWKLDKLLPALTRFESGAELAGEFDADAKVSLSPAKDSLDWTWDGTASLRQLTLTGLAALNNDKVALETISAGGRLASQRGRLSMDNAKLTTDVGELTATGDIPLAGLTGASALNAAQSILGEEDCQIEGHVDLKRLAALLPQTLRVREGTEITGGRLQLKLVGADQEGKRSWHGGASLAGLTALNRGEAIAWTTPLTLKFQAHRQEETIVVDQLACQSDFLNVSGSGTLTDAHFTATGDLNKLEQNLERFVDLGIEKMAGRVRADGSIKREENDKASLVAMVHLDGFQWNISARTVWHEPQLELTAKASAQTDGGTKLQRIDSAELRLTSGSDSLAATLQDAIDLNATATTWPVTATLSGSLETWQNRMRPFITLSGWQLGGTAKFEATIAAGPKQIEVERFAADIEELQARGPEWLVQEPQFKLETSGTWKIIEREWSSPKTTLVSSAVSCRVDDLAAALSKTGALARLSGNAAYRADLDRLSKWKNHALELPSYHLLGALSGRANVTQENSTMSADLEATVDKLVVAALQTPAGQQPHWEALWREPQLRWSGQGSYDSSSDDLKLDATSIEADGFSMSAKGSLAKLFTKRQIDLTGQLGYDWEVLVSRFGETFGKDIQLAGKDQRPFSLKGSLASLSGSTVAAAGQTPATSISFPNGTARRDVSQNGSIASAGLSDLGGQAGLGWKSASVYGLVAGPADVSAHLDKGICQFATLDTSVSEGRLHFTPQVRLDQMPWLIVLPKEKVIDQVKLSPELCNSWLKFVAPLLADAAQIDGKFSLNVAGGTLPLMTPTAGELSGVLAIHSAQVRPGPFSLQIVNLVEQIQSVIRQRAARDPQRERVWMEMPEQPVDFRLTEGRMHHRSLTFLIQDVTVRTSGSVGMDETLNLIAEVGIPDDWVADKKILAGLKGKAIRIPIGGTLTRPQIDNRVLGELARQVGGSAIEGLIEDKLDGLFKKKLNKLLPE